MNFCIFSANYLPHIGGIERYTYYLSKELIKRGHTVTVVTENVVKGETHEISDGIEIFRFPCYNLINGRYPITKKNKLSKEIDTEINGRKFDFVIINARFYLHSIYAAKFAHKHSIPMITIEHGSSHLSVNNRLFDYLGAKWEHFITERLKKYCKDYYGVSKAACDWSGHFGIKSKGVLYNSIDLTEIESLCENPVCDYRKDLGIPKSAKVIVFTGRLIKEKGIYQLAKGFISLNDSNAYLLIAGDGPEMQGLKDIGGEHIYLLGKLDFSHIIALLKDSDIFCLPSVSEGMSTSVLEATATKTFVITTKTGGSKELINSDELGIVTDGNTEDEVFKALKCAIQNDEYRDSATQKAYDRLKEYFVWEKTADKVEDICKKTKGIRNENADNNSGI